MRSLEPEDPVVVLCTAPSDEVAASLARGLVEGRLAACVSLLGGLRSIYRWQGAVEDASEVQLVVKTRAARLPDIEAFLREHHPYEVPELLALPVAAGGAAYLAWLSEQSR